jgi:hypothetical protein
MVYFGKKKITLKIFSETWAEIIFSQYNDQK